MKVRIASPMTIFSGFITSRTLARWRSRRISFIAIRFSDSRLMSANTAWVGMGMSSSVRAIGPAVARIWRSKGNTLSIHQRATSGNDSSRSVSPVGAQSTTIDFPLAGLVRALELQQGEQLIGSRAEPSAPGPRCGQGHGPRTARPAIPEPLTSGAPSPPGRSPAGPRGWARPASDRRRARPRATPSRLWAGSVEITSVRSPARAQARAVQAATEVFPTPPLPV